MKRTVIHPTHRIPLCALSAAGLFLLLSSSPTGAEARQPAAESNFAQSSPGSGAASARAKTGDAARRDRLMRETGNDIDFDAEAAKKRDQQVETLTRVIPKTTGLAKADLLFRLAELWWEKSRIAAREAVKNYDAALDQWIDAGGESSGSPEPRLDDFLSESEVFRHEALRTYGTILEGWPDYPRRDEVLFADAYNKSELNRKAEAAEGYRRLTSEFPRSKFIFDAFVQLGELEFDGGHLAQAREAYEQALQAPSAPLRNFAKYRLAWCDFNAGEDADGVRRLKEVVGESGSSGLGKEAMNDLAGGFARLEDMDAAVAWFSSKDSETLVGIPETRRLIRKTASLLLQAGRTAEARKGYSFLLQTDRFDPLGPEDQRAVVDSFEADRNREAVLRELKILSENYASGSAWAQANASNQAVLDKAADAAETAMRTLVADYHEEAQRTQDAATYRAARDIYSEYLNRFEKSPMANELAFFHGEILWALGEFSAAGRQYSLSFRLAPGGRFARDAAYNAVLAFEKAVSAERKGAAAAPELDDKAKVREGEKKAALQKGHKEALLKAKNVQGNGASDDAEGKEEKLTSTESELADAIDRFAAAFPKDPEAIAARYRAAHLFFVRHSDVEAARRLGSIIVDFPQDPWSRRAVSLTLNLLERRHAWEDLHRQAERFSENVQLIHGDKAFRDSLKELAAAALYKHLDEVIAPSAPDGAARAAGGFLALSERYPNSKYAAMAAFHALISFEEASDLESALETGLKILNTWPKAATAEGRPLTAETARRTASLLFQAGRLGEADELFSRSFKVIQGNSKELKPPSDDPTEKNNFGMALLQAAACSEAGFRNGSASQADEARRRLLAFSRLFPDRPEARAAALKAASIAAASGKPAEGAAEAMAILQSAGGKDLPNLQKLQVLWDIFQWLTEEKTGKSKSKSLRDEAARQARQLYGSLPAGEKNSEIARNAFAGISFLQLEPAYAAAVAIDFQNISGSKKLKAMLSDKIKRVGELEKAYLETAAVGSGEWTFASLTRLGQIYADLARKILDSPDPPDLTPDELDMYREALENQAFPLEEKAIQAFEGAISRGMEVKSYGPWLLEAEEGLESLKNGTFAPVRNAFPILPFISSEKRPFPSGASTASAAVSGGSASQSEQEVEK